MAIYLYDEYFADYPYRPKTVLDKFVPAKKYLHEMTLEEVNAYVAGWKPFSSNTAAKMKREIKVYFDYLIKLGVKADPKLYIKMNIPVKSNEYLIYSTDDIRKYWDILLNAMKEHSKKIGKFFSPQPYYVTIAAGILSFYGLDTEEIFSLPRFDVTPNGVKGYDLPLTQEDIDDLIRYRDLKEMANRVSLTGDMYIRSGKQGTSKTIPRDFLTTALRRSDNVDEDHKYLKPYLTDTYLYKMGMFDRAYNYERENSVVVEFDRNTPEWFANIMGNVAKDALLKLKKEFIEYRSERRTAEKLENRKPKVIIKAVETKEQETKSELKKKLSEIFSDIDELQNQAKIICKKLESIE